MITSNEMDGVLLLENEDQDSAADTGSNTSVPVADLDNMTAIADLMDSDSGARLFHDGKGTIYGVKLNADQQVIAQDGKVDLILLKSGLEADASTTFTAKAEGNSIVVARNETDRETIVSGDQLGLNGDITVTAASASSQAAEAAETSQADAETEAAETEAVTEAPAETKAETEAAETEEQDAVLTIGAESAAAETDAALVATWAAVPTEPAAVQPAAGNGVLIWAIGASVVAAAALAGCAMLFKKSADSEKTKKLKDTELKALQRSVDDKTSAFSKSQERIRELETQVAEANEQINVLKDEARTTAAQIEDGRQKLENMPSEEDLHSATARADELQKRYDELYIRARDLHRENEQYAARIRELEVHAGAIAPAAAAASADEPAPAEDAPAVAAAASGSDPVLLCTSVDELEKYADPVYAAPTNSKLSDVTVLNKAPFRRAQLVIINGKAYLNPHFFRALGSGMESYNNLSGLENVFETEGLGSNAMKYKLSEFTPAEVSFDAETDTYRVDQPGKMVLHIG